MDASLKVLIVAGVLSLAYGFLLGISMARSQMHSPQAPRQLVNTHLEALIQGAVLLGLAVAADFSTLSDGLETTAAWILAAACAISLAGGTANWLQNVEDPFASRPLGWLLQAVSGPLNILGLALIVVGVFKAL